MKNNYVNAVLALINDGKDFQNVSQGLKKTLVDRGHQSLYPAILEAVLRIIEAKSLEQATVTVAKESDFSSWKNDIEVELEKIVQDATLTIKVDKTLVGGYVLEANSLRLDKSYKNSLVKLYRKLTQN